MSKTTATQVSLDALRKGKRNKLILLVIWVVLLTAGGAGWWFLRPELTAEVQAVQRGPAVSAVYGTVNVEPVVQTIIRAQSSGVISDVKVKKGDVVKENDLLAEITDDTADQALKSAQTAYDNAVRQREIGAATAPAADSKRKQVEQLAKLLKDGNIAGTEYDRNVSELRTLDDRVKTENLQLDAQVEQAQQKLDAAKNSNTQRFVRSPQNGVIMDFNTQLGQVITSREQMFIIGSEACQLRAQINEEDVGALKEGMQAIVRLYSYPGRDFPATLKEILPAGKNQEYSVILLLTEPPERLLPGMTGELNIIVGRHENTLIIPTRAIRLGVSPSVLVVADHIVRSVPVELGFRSIEMAEVAKGLNEGDLVILSDHDLFKPGQKVRTHSR